MSSDGIGALAAVAQRVDDNDTVLDGYDESFQDIHSNFDPEGRDESLVIFEHAPSGQAISSLQELSQSTPPPPPHHLD